MVKELAPGRYCGKVVLYVSDYFVTRPTGLMKPNQKSSAITPAVCIDNGKLISEKSVPEARWGGSVSNKVTDGIYVGAAAVFNGVIVRDSKYVVKNSRFDMEGFGPNDFTGEGSGVAVYGDSRVEIDDCEFNISGVTRCAIHVDGTSMATINNSKIINISTDNGSDWLGRFTWQIALRGSNRLVQCTEDAQVTYNNCLLKTNGWGVASIDGGAKFNKMTFKDCTLELTGPGAHGYGAFLIGAAEVTYDNSVVDVYGYPMFIMGYKGKGRAEIINGSAIKGRRFGAMVLADDCSIFTIKDSTFDTTSANLVVKGSITTIDIDNSVMKSKEGTLLRLMDNEESDMLTVKMYVPVGKKDVYVQGRDLTKASATEDIILNLSNMSVEGDVFNSTTNLMTYKLNEPGGMGPFHDTVIGPVIFSGPADPNAPTAVVGLVGHTKEELSGPKNLAVNMKNAKVKGLITAASQAYRDGLTEITCDNWYELSNVTQAAAKPVNNGVIVSIDSDSVWTVTGTSYLTSLTIAKDAKITAGGGKTVKMSVDGKDTPIAPGKYTGVIKITLA